MNAQLNDIIDLAAATPSLAALWLYGSRARGDSALHSDYDLAVAFNDWEQDALERRLRPELLALDWSKTLSVPEGKLSIVDIGIAPVPLAWSILSEGKLLLDQSPQIRMTQEARIMSMWELDYLYHQKQFA